MSDNIWNEKYENVIYSNLSLEYEIITQPKVAYLIGSEYLKSINSNGVLPLNVIFFCQKCVLNTVESTVLLLYSLLKNTLNKKNFNKHFKIRKCFISRRFKQNENHFTKYNKLKTKLMLIKQH